jgi:serine/threonine-protein kinase
MPDSLSHYTLLEKIGTGGMGTVYRAEDTRSGDIVALKTLHPHLAADAEYVRRFEAEARIAQSIDSPNVVKVLDNGHDGDTYFLVMEFVPGRSLAEVIAERGALPIDEAVSIAAAIARALVAANAKAIVHRDISPQNVMITPEGVAKVTDFGVSRDLTQNTMTATSMLMGKPLYIAPEVATGASKADIRADIYALGVVLFQMLTGRVPFDAATPFAVMQMHVSDPVPSVGSFRAGMPGWLKDLVERCLEKDRSRRFRQPEEVLATILLGPDGPTIRVVRDLEPTIRFGPLEQETLQVQRLRNSSPDNAVLAPTPHPAPQTTGGSIGSQSPDVQGALHDFDVLQRIYSEPHAAPSWMALTVIIVTAIAIALLVVFAYAQVNTNKSQAHDTVSPNPALSHGAGFHFYIARKHSARD